MRLFGKENPKTIDFDIIPTSVFTVPPIGSIGPSESEAELKYGKERIKVYKKKFYDYKETMKKEGLKSVIKMICLLPEEQIISFFGFGNKMDEIVQCLSLSINHGITKNELDSSIGVHPTVSEFLLNIK